MDPCGVPSSLARTSPKLGRRTGSDVPVPTGTSEIFILGGGPQGHETFLRSLS